MVKVKVKTVSKKKPVKAGRRMPKNLGGIINAKVVATAKKIKDG